MKNKIRSIVQYITTICVLTLLFFSCKDENITNPIPVISLHSYEIIKKDSVDSDSLFIVRINYEDEDGDLGLSESDTLPPFDVGKYRYNLWVDIKDVKNGVEEPIVIFGTTDPQNFNKRFRSITPTGKHKSVSGVLEIQFDASVLFLYPDTINARVQLLDRALNKSEVVELNNIVLKH